MRTTVELSGETYRRLRAEAASRGLRGLSPVVEEALEEHFRSESHRERLAEAIAAAEGAWSDEDVADFESAREQAWATWRPPPSSTQTS